MGHRTLFSKSETLAEHIKEGNFSGVLWAIRRGADIDARVGRLGITPLIEAVLSPDRAIAELLIRNGAAINKRDNDGNSALHWTDDMDMMELLIRNGADINAENNLGHTPLSGVMLRATTGNAEFWGGYPQTIEFLLDNGARAKRVRITDNEALMVLRDEYSRHVTVIQYVRKKQM
jgi:hypothetical protein